MSMFSIPMAGLENPGLNQMNLQLSIPNTENGATGNKLPAGIEAGKSFNISLDNQNGMSSSLKMGPASNNASLNPEVFGNAIADRFNLLHNRLEERHRIGNSEQPYKINNLLIDFNGSNINANNSLMPGPAHIRPNVDFGGASGKVPGDSERAIDIMRSAFNTQIEVSGITTVATKISRTLQMVMRGS